MKLIIAGGRDYQLTPGDIRRLDKILDAHEITEVVSGGASGADKAGEAWATDRGIAIKRFEADLERKLDHCEIEKWRATEMLCWYFQEEKERCRWSPRPKRLGIMIIDWR